MYKFITTIFLKGKDVTYYVETNKGSNKFHFTPSLLFKDAPSFVLIYDGTKSIAEGVTEEILHQAEYEVRQLLKNHLPALTQNKKSKI